jgi:hypothetical protein
MTIDLTIQNSGAASTDYIVTIKDSGYGYTAGDTLGILDANLAAVGAIVGGAGNLTFSVGTVSANTDAGQIFSVAQTTNQVVKPSSTGTSSRSILVLSDGYRSADKS